MELPTNRFVSTTIFLMKCVVNWIPLRMHVRLTNSQPHVKKEAFVAHHKPTKIGGFEVDDQKKSPHILFYFSLIWLRVHAFAIHSMVHCGSAFEPDASLLLHLHLCAFLLYFTR